MVDAEALGVAPRPADHHVGGERVTDTDGRRLMQVSTESACSPSRQRASKSAPRR